MADGVGRRCADHVGSTASGGPPKATQAAEPMPDLRPAGGHTTHPPRRAFRQACPTPPGNGLLPVSSAQPIGAERRPRPRGLPREPPDLQQGRALPLHNTVVPEFVHPCSWPKHKPRSRFLPSFFGYPVVLSGVGKGKRTPFIRCQNANFVRVCLTQSCTGP